MLSTIFVILFFAAFLLFIYEGIIAPSLRCRLRFAVFELRDRLRGLKISHREEFDEDCFREMEDGLNVTISTMNAIDVFALHRARIAFNNNSALRERVKARVAKVESCKIEEAKQIIADAVRYFSAAIFINNLIFFLMLLPFFILVIVTKNVTDFLKRVLLLPPYEAASILCPDRTQLI